MKRLVWKSFRYRECDEFAAYLKRMAAGGRKEWQENSFKRSQNPCITS